MNWEMLAAVAEAVGAAGVIGSVLYLAAQVRQGTRASRRTNAHNLNQATRDWWAQITQEDAANVWRKGLLDYSSLSGDEAVRLSCLLLELMTISEELHYAQIDGDVPGWVGRPYLLGRREVASMPGFREWYEQRGHWLSPEFRKIVETEMLEGADKLPAARFYRPDPELGES